MLTNKDIRVENGNIVLNGDKYPLDGLSPETIMQIVEDNSDTTPTEDSTAPITSGGTYTAIATVNTAIGNVSDTIGDLTQTGVTGETVAAQIATLKGSIKGVIVDTVNLSDNIPSINANSYGQYTISAIKAGYIPIAVVGVSYTGGIGVDVARFYVSGTDAVLLLHNVTSSTYTPTTLTAHVLYVEA